MKTFRIKLSMAAVLIMAAIGASAQDYSSDPRYGSTPEERNKNVLELQFFNDAYNNKDWDTALKHLRPLLQGAPKATENLYIKGATIYKNKIARATSVAEKRAYIDTLMMIYDQRVANYGDHPERGLDYILSNKAKDFLTYNPADRAAVREHFKKAMEAGSLKVDPELMVIYFNELSNDYKNDEIEADFYISEYERLGAMFDVNSDAGKEAKNTFEALFVQSGAASCENLEKIYRPKLAAAPDDVELYKKVFNMLGRAKCNNDFQLEVGEKLYALQPDSDVAVILAVTFEERKEFTKALKYLNENVAHESDPVKKSNLLVRIAASQLGNNNARSAADYCRQAADANPDNGYAYLILGQAYAVGVSGCTDFEKRAAYWLVYDTLAKARAMLASGDAEAQEQAKNLESQMGSYRAGFPTKEDCFFRDLKPGDGYTVNCGWVSGRTTVRER